MSDPKLKVELAKLEQSALIDLWEIDLRKHFDKEGNAGELYRFYAGAGLNDKPIIWQGKEYVPYGVATSGFKLSSQGASNRPTLSLGNINGFVTRIIYAYQQCLGAIVRRRRVCVRFLDAVNFEDGNPYADPSIETVSIFVIEQLSSHKRDLVSFVLATPVEMDGAQIPCRTILTMCPWPYRGVECGYDGPPVADEKDQPTTDPEKDKCSRCKTGCGLRRNLANFGGFPSVDKLG